LLRKSDELSGACRTFLEELKIYLKEKKKRSFYSKEIRLDLRKNYSSLKRYLINLSQNGYVKIVGGTKSRGFEYEVVNLEEYKELKSKVKTVLDDILKGISGSVDQSGSK
jgi:DNA primase